MAHAVLARRAMIARRATYLRLLSILVAAAAAPSLAGACGGKTDDGSSGATSDSAGSAGTSGSSGKGTSTVGSSGGSGSLGSSGTSGASGTTSGCGTPSTVTSTIDRDRCAPQVQTITSCGGSICSWTVELPCAPDGGAGDPDGGWQPPPPCEELCEPTRPPAVALRHTCGLIAQDGGAVVVYCGGGCGAGRPPRGFVAQPTAAPSDAAERLARMAQLEAASVEAFHALHADLVRFGAPRSLLESVRAAAKDEVRHARQVRAAAERLGARVPDVTVPKAKPRSLLDLAIENAEEGCVNETFGAALAAMQAEHAADPRVKKMMRGIARDELGHAALSWQLADWLDARLDADGRARVRAARSTAIAALERDLANEGCGSALLGLPDTARARVALRGMSAALESGSLRSAA